MPNAAGLFPGDPGYVETSIRDVMGESPQPQQPPTPAPTTLTAEQIDKLNVAQNRVNAGTPGLKDQANLDYAKSRYGFTAAPKSTNLGVDNLGMGKIDVPDQTPSQVTALGNQVATTGMSANEIAIARYIEEQRKLTEQNRIDEQKRSDAALAGLNTAYDTSSEDKLRALYQEQDITGKRKTLEDINAQIQLNKGALDQGMINIEGQPIAMDFIVGQQALLQRQASAKINTLMSQAALAQDNLNYATDIANKYYAASEIDRKNQIDRYQNLFNLHNDNLINLKKDEKEFINSQIALLQQQDERQRADRDKVIALMTENPEAWAKANVSFDMPYEEILQRVAPQLGVVAGQKSEQALVADLAKKYSDAGISLTDTLASAQAKLKNSKIYKQETRLAGGGGGGGGGSATDPAIQFYVDDFRGSGLSFVEWASQSGLDTATKNKIAAALKSSPAVIPPTTVNLDENGNPILGQDLDTGEYITQDNVSDIMATKEQQLAEARRMNQQNPSVMFKRRITELENDISDLRQAAFGEPLTQG